MRVFRCPAVLLAGLMVSLVSAPASALPFQSIDAHTLSMGGAGVASGSSLNAVLINPALLVSGQERRDFFVSVPAAWREMDPNSLTDEIDRYQHGEYEATFNKALQDFREPGGSQDKKITTALGDSVIDIIRQMKRMTHKEIEGEYLAGLVVGLPGKKLGMSLVATRWGVGGAKLKNFDQDTQAFNEFLDALSKGTFSPFDEVFDIEIGPTGRNLVAVLAGRGAVVSEFGLAMAREFRFNGNDFVVGLTPKYVSVSTFDYEQPLNVASFSYSTGTQDYSNFNMDLGVTHDYSNGWKAGFSAKNIIPQRYETVLHNKVRIYPQMRVGLAKKQKWGTAVVDLDINESKPLGEGIKTQYLALGAEFDVAERARMRVGYRHNMSYADASLVTFGAGINIFWGGLLEFGVGLNEDEGIFSGQLSYSF